jgi:hypothetical protein
VNTKQNSKFRHKNGKKRQSLWQKLCCFSWTYWKSMTLLLLFVYNKNASSYF